MALAGRSERTSTHACATVWPISNVQRVGPAAPPIVRPGAEDHEERSLSSYDPTRYGRVVSDSYDTLYPLPETPNTVALVAELALAHPARSVVEFGIGTGRLALALVATGLTVAGIDSSQGMVDQLRQKPGGETIPVTIGDFRDATIAGRYSVAVLVFNGILDPRGTAAQIDIFRNAARHLAPGGYFVIESLVLSDQQRDGNWFVTPRYVGERHIEVQLARYDIETNHIERTLLHLRGEGLDFVTVTDIYASPGELDIMAEVTRFERHARYSSWSKTPFIASSSLHITVYRLRATLP